MDDKSSGMQAAALATEDDDDGVSSLVDMINSGALSLEVERQMKRDGERNLLFYQEVMSATFDRDLLRSKIFPEDASKGPCMRMKQSLYKEASKPIVGEYAFESDPVFSSASTAHLRLVEKSKILSKDIPEIVLDYNQDPSVISVDESNMIVTDVHHPQENQTRIFFQLDNGYVLSIPTVNPWSERIYRYTITSVPQDKELLVYDNLEDVFKNYPNYAEKLFTNAPDDDDDDEEGGPEQYLKLDRSFLGVSGVSDGSDLEVVARYHIPMELNPLQYVMHKPNLYLFTGKDQEGNNNCLYALNTELVEGEGKPWIAPWTKVKIYDSETYVDLTDPNTLTVFEDEVPSYRLTIEVSEGSNIGVLSVPDYPTYDIPSLTLIEEVNDIVLEAAEEEDDED
ncbi:hypothetical protein AbHV_ORF9 [Abalone herpesvirus Victoria/AUS/2009]|uniref:Uncharacterized protein n=1 Tax=Abalone herpesvirus (isolate Abalone/Australia/Victoria/2009) TaxID=1241371 RepID=K4JUD7_ABHV|nr:hypothetical protein AbHV_ORF9 [Abalone herpesvirus Victoria/AUS/2009]AFU90019.1 hypothetical protein AbHV_ORF9 [Abalone herpesvirus Victoria/AUS/2009]